MTTTHSELLTLTNKDQKFYQLIGPFLGRRDVHRAIGSAVYDDNDKTWLVIVTGKRVEGFIAYRPQRGVIVAESGYVVRRDNAGVEDQNIRLALVQHLIEATAPSPLRTMVPKSASSAYIDAGFTELPQKSTRNYAELVRTAA